MQLHYHEISFARISSLDAPDNWRSAASSTFNRMWSVLSAADASAAADGASAASASSAADDSCLLLDPSHMSIEGQRAQHVFEDYAAAFAPSVDIDAGMAAARAVLPAALQRLVAAVRSRPDIACDVSEELLQKVAVLVQRVLECNDAASAGNRTLRSRCCVLADVLRRTCNAMTEDEVKLTMAPAVVQQWADASQHCLSRWEGEVFCMHDWVCGQRSCVQSRDAEDVVLRWVVCVHVTIHITSHHITPRILHDSRAQLAEGLLHALKACVAVADELHFENFFYAQLRVGVQAQTRGEADASRMNYVQMHTFDRSLAASAFARVYTPAHMRDVLRAQIFEAEGGAATRELLCVLPLLLPAPKNCNTIAAVTIGCGAPCPWVSATICRRRSGRRRG
jgi:hypothetical protein